MQNLKCKISIMLKPLIEYRIERQKIYNLHYFIFSYFMDRHELMGIDKNIEIHITLPKKK